MSPSSQPTFVHSITYDIATMTPLFWDEEPWGGRWERAKKGRGEQKEVTNESLANSKTDQATRQAQLDKENAGLDTLTHTNPNGLSDEAQSQYGQDIANIGKTYTNARAVGLRSIGQRGMSNAPTGAESSLLSSADRAQAGDENAAFNTGLERTHQDLLTSLNARQGLQQIYDPNAALGTASSSAARQAQQGSLAGDIGAGLTTAAGLSLVGAKIHG